MADPRARTAAPRRVIFLLVPHVHLLDLSGPAQVFYEANGFGGDYDVRFCSTATSVRTAQGLTLAGLEPLPEIGPGDLVLVPGMDSATIPRLTRVPKTWLRGIESAGGSVGAICSGAFALGAAGLLDDRHCTTHWKVAGLLQKLHPRARVHENRLFVRDGRLITSAGVTAGIDMALSLVEEHYGPGVVSRVAKEMVVYLRRQGESGQESVFLAYRTHLHSGIHKTQDWILSHVEEMPTLDTLAGVAGMSPRNLTRVFKLATGITLKEYATRLKLEVAVNLLRNPDYTVERVAAECGFQDSRQLRRLWTRNFGTTPSSWREADHGRAST